MNFAQKLEDRVTQAQNPICMGMDPVLSLIPLEGTPEEKIRTFYLKLFEEMDRRGVYPAVVKPNSAYYECVSVEAMVVLRDLIDAARERGILVILDAKRGDIGKSSAAYAKAADEVYHADSVTVSPYMGKDSLMPFLEQREGFGVYSLLRTSNKGATDFQDLIAGKSGTIDSGKIDSGRSDSGETDQALFYSVAAALTEWNNGNLGAVVGATNPAELENITRWFCSRNAEIPFLIPGVSIPGVPGQQGGDAKTVLNALKSGGSKQQFHVLNSSSGLNFAWQAKNTPANYAADCVDALEALIESCGN